MKQEQFEIQRSPNLQTILMVEKFIEENDLNDNNTWFKR